MSFMRPDNIQRATLISTYTTTYQELDSTTSPRSVMRDWRSALRTPPTYRIGNRTLRFNYHFALLTFCSCALFILFFYIRTGSKSSSDAAWLRNAASISNIKTSYFSNGYLNLFYNTTYPLTAPLILRGGALNYRIAMVADLDTNSKITKEDGSIVWRSYLKKGLLSYVGSKNDIKISWDDAEPTPLESSFSLKGRGMELSELVTYNGKLICFDDRTGIVYELLNGKPIPWVILLDGDGHSTKGFKSEWATVKEKTLFVGSMGKEWTTSLGDFQNENPMYIKMISSTGEIRSVNWSNNFKVLREESLQIAWPGYMIHESGVWSDIHSRWFFLPRRCSKEKYNETRDERMGCNVLISATDDFSNIHTVNLDSTNTSPSHGFSSFKFLPGTEDRIIVAIKSEELNGKTSTFITAFDINGKTLLPEQKIETMYKYEGFEFI